MLKIKILMKKVIAVSSLVTLFSIYLGSSALAAAPPLSPGCYINTSGDFTITTCSSENQQRSIVAPYNKCFIIAASVNGFSGAINKEADCTTGTIIPVAEEANGTPAGGSTEDEGTRLSSRPDDCTEETIDGSNCGIVRYLNIFMNLVSGIIAIAVIGNIIYAGIQYSTAQGDPGNVGKAKTRIRNALVAFLMYLSLFAFLQWLIPGGAF